MICIELLAEDLTCSDSDDIFCVGLIRCCSVSILSSIEPITSTLEAIIFESRTPLMNVRIPVSLAPGIEGSRWPFNSQSEELFAFPNRCFRRYQYPARSFFSRCFRACRPKIERKAVIETIITAILASVSNQNTFHCMSIFL